MDHTAIVSQSQDPVKVESKIDHFFNRFKIATMMHRCGIRKHHGHSVRCLTQSIFALPFIGKNLFRGIVLNEQLAFGKDAAYELLKGTTYNWRRLLLDLGAKLFGIFNRLTSDERESVLIIDDSTYERSRSKKVELLSRIFDHSTGRFLKGFRMLTIGWSDGTSYLPLDFALLSSSDAKNRLYDSHKILDKRCCAYQRRKEATIKATAHLENMVKRVLAAGVTAKYLVMDSWFTMPANIVALAPLIKTIGMVKKSSRVHYRYNGYSLDLMAIYRRVAKRRGRAKILASTIVMLNDTVAAKLVFVRDRGKKNWLALLSTDIDLPQEDIVRIYGKRWDIEVFFKMAKQHLKLAKEIQCRDYDALIAHTTIVFMRYMFLAFECRMATDQKTFGELFYACCDEVADISFLDALSRILTLAVERLQQFGNCCANTAARFFEEVINAALQYVGLSKSRLRIA